MVEKYVIRTAICTCCYGCQLLLAGDEFKNKKYDNHGQLVKALRYIDFIDETDSKRGGVYPYYDVIEKITNISQWDALDLYIKMCEIEEDKHDR